ncbi:MAG: DNA methyltransferase [Gemmatimonadota bacterium]
MSVETKLFELAERWKDAGAAERANAQLYLTELAEALEVERPGPRGSGYEFEIPIKVVNRDGTDTTEFADLFKEGCFLLEAKDQVASRTDDALLRKAYGQVRSYVTHVPGAAPPYLLVLDVGRTLIVWDRWTGTYGGFKAGRRINLATLHERPEDIAVLRDVWESPARRDPRREANAVTREVAAKLAELAASLERRGLDHGRVARFLIRCVFTMFAEDVGLLKDEPFLRAIRDFGMQDPEEFRTAVKELWAAMDQGTRFGLHKLLEFDGHFFRDQEVIPLTREDLAVLLEAARKDWSSVEPSIMGTLLVRAFDPEKRHRLGAEFTPREYVDRLVRPTIEEPIREQWTLIEAEVVQLRERGRPIDLKRAVARLWEFHGWLRELRVLDPACGSGNFLYVAMETVKKVEMEVLHTIEELTGQPEMAVEEVGPWQFLGIEVDPWAREIAELTLWIGYHQFWMAHHGHTLPPEPVLRDSGNLELKDAVLAWDEVLEDPERSRPDPTPSVPHPVTGEVVPDPKKRLPYLVYRGARPAEWPEVDFIVGNPPYMGRGRQREAFGDGYVEALRAAYPDVNENSDYVMFWWHRAAESVATGRTIRAGLITTNTITQRHNREAIEWAREKGVGVVWAVPDHPWVDEVGAADVRVAMTVTSREPRGAVRLEVGAAGEVTREVRVAELHADLSAGVDVAGAASVPLLANRGLSSQGFTLVGQGFVLDGEEARALLDVDPRHGEVIRPYLSGRDLTQRARDQFVIDFALLAEKRARAYPVLYDLVRDRVKPARDANSRMSYRRYWWRFGEPRHVLREALPGLTRFIATPETSKHRVFAFLPVEAACAHKIIVIALDDSYSLGVLSSTIHAAWTIASGGRLGVGNDPVYQKSQTFDAFPFPSSSDPVRDEIRRAAEAIDAHRKAALERDGAVTMTGMYNVVEALRAGTELSKAERKIHQAAACGILKDLHDELDALVAEAYGWPWPLEEEEILDRLVRLHDERWAEEEAGNVRWLRPDYQVPKFRHEVVPEAELELVTEEEPQAGEIEALAWPESTLDQIGLLKSVVEGSPGSAEEVRSRFDRASLALVERHLETLEIVGELRRGRDGRYRAPVSLEKAT